MVDTLPIDDLSCQELSIEISEKPRKSLITLISGRLHR